MLSAEEFEDLQRDCSRVSSKLSALLHDLEQDGRTNLSGYKFVKDTLAEIEYLPAVLVKLLKATRPRQSKAKEVDMP